MKLAISSSGGSTAVSAPLDQSGDAGSTPAPLLQHITHRTLRVSEIRVPLFGGGNFQRPLNALRARKLARYWNPLLADPISVAVYDGEPWVYDGQHRLEAHRLMGRDLIECRVAFGYGAEEAARAFSTQGDQRTKPGAASIWRSGLVGGVPEIVAADSVIAAIGYEVDHHVNPSGRVNALRCHAAIMGITKDQGLAVLQAALIAFREARWTGNNIQAMPLHAVAIFIARTKATEDSTRGRFIRKRLADVLTGLSSASMASGAGIQKAANPKGTMYDSMAQFLRVQFNYRLRTGQVTDWRR